MSWIDLDPFTLALTRLEVTELNLRNLIRNLISRPATQPVLSQMLKLCHAGMNYGGGQSVEKSGEIGALKFVAAGLEESRALTLFDIGANDGQYVNVALRVLADRLNVYSFEPQSASFSKLQARFGNRPGVKLKKAAVGRTSGTLDLFLDRDDESAASLHRSRIAVQTRCEKVEVTTVDATCREEGIDRIDFLKIDTERHEVDVLLGASGMIEAVQFEFGDTFLHTPFHLFDLWDLLSPRYTIYRILRHGLVKVPQYACDLEIYKIVNFLCILNR